MSVLIHCPQPSCSQAIRVQPEFLGRNLRCPRCGGIFTLPAAADAPGTPPAPAPAATLPLPPDTAPAASPSTAPAVSPATLPLPEQPAAPAPTLDDLAVRAETAAVTPAAISAPADAQAAGEPVPARVGRFEIRERLGEGTFGVVYRAYDPQLDREVALKVAKPESLSSPQRVQRFLREAKAAGNLRHPHIVPVYDSGRDGNHYYIASAFISGGSLEHALRQQTEGSGLAVRRAAEIVRRLAEALAYAHGRGVVHRDVKPANAMLDEHGEPLLLDFGLAARDEGGEKLTQEGVRGMGTPAYMAPEQAAGQAGPASDQYSLGCTLYELLTGQTPFAGPPELQMFLHQTEQAPSPRRRNHKVPRDLETICLKCLEKDVGRRYAGCQELADDLRRFLDGEPVKARRLGVAERLVRWVRREPRLAGAIGVALAALITVGVVFAIGEATQRGLNKQLGDTNRQLSDTIKKVRMDLYSRQLDEAYRAWLAHDIVSAEHIMDRMHEGPRGWEWNWLWRLCQYKAVRLGGHTAAVRKATWSPDGKRLATASEDKTVRVWDAASGQQLLSLPGHTDRVFAVAWSPDSKHLATASQDKTARVWDAASGQQLLSLQGHTGYIDAVAWSPDSKHLATASQDKTARVWDAASGQQLLSLQGHTGYIDAVAWSPDGKRLATASQDKTARVWDAASGQQLLSLPGHNSWVTAVAWSPDGKRLATASADKTARIWDTASGQQLLSLQGHTGSVFGVTAVAWSPDGKRLATASEDKTARVWDAASGQQLLCLQGHNESVSAVAWSPDGKRLVTTSWDRTARVWNLAISQPLLVLKGHSRLVRGVAWSPDGKRLATASDDKTVRVWDAASGQQLLSLLGHDGFISAVAWSPDGNRLASASGNGMAGVRVWDAASGQQLLSLQGHSITAIAWSPDGKRLVTASEDQTLRVWDAASGQQFFSFRAPHRWHRSVGVNDVAWSPDGQRLVTISGWNALFWDAASGQRVPLSLHYFIEGKLQFDIEGLNAVAWSLDGKRLATASQDKTVRVWDAASGLQSLVIRGHTRSVSGVAWSPDGKRLITASEDKTMRIWDGASGQQLLSVQIPTDGNNGLAWSPDKASGR